MNLTSHRQKCNHREFLKKLSKTTNFVYKFEKYGENIG